jgi:hypothetical protein
MVATDVDLDSTYVGGTPHLIQRLVSDSELEVAAVSGNDSITWNSDTLNLA